jgi:hypothetical protein
MILFLWLLACMGGDVLPALAPPQADVTAVAVDAKVDAGEPVLIDVKSWASSGWDVHAGIPFSEGLEVELVSEDGPIQIDDRTVHTWRYALTGSDGSYVVAISEGQARGPGDQERTFELPPVFVDIGVQGPSGGPMDGFAVAPPASPPPYRWMALAVGLVLVLMALIWAIRRKIKGRPPVIPPPIPAHIVAQGAWADARAQIAEDHPLAIRLSMVLREYIEARAGVPATRATTNEILKHFEYHGFDGVAFDIEARMRVQRILDATDRLKFAREGGGEAFFVSLDKDFEGIIDATRPHFSLDGGDNA